MERESTNSITHLVKIVAEEVARKVIKEEVERLEHLNKCNQEASDFFMKIAREHVETLRSSVENAGAPWSNSEKCYLREEFKVAVAQIAANHKRSIGAIKEALKKMNMIEYL